MVKRYNKEVVKMTKIEDNKVVRGITKYLIPARFLILQKVENHWHSWLDTNR